MFSSIMPLEVLPEQFSSFLPSDIFTLDASFWKSAFSGRKLCIYPLKTSCIHVTSVPLLATSEHTWISSEMRPQLSNSSVNEWETMLSAVMDITKWPLKITHWSWKHALFLLGFTFSLTRFFGLIFCSLDKEWLAL